MKGFLFSPILLLILVAGCSDHGGNILGPSSDDQKQVEDQFGAPAKAPDSVILENTDDDDDEHPWEDHRPDEHGPPAQEPGNKHMGPRKQGDDKEPPKDPGLHVVPNPA